MPRLDLHGDPLPEGATARLGTVRWRNAAGWTCVTFAPDGKVLACGSNDHTIRLLDADTGKELRVLRGHTKPVAKLSFHAGGTVLASAASDGTLRRWEVATGRLLSSVPIRWSCR